MGRSVTLFILGIVVLVILVVGGTNAFVVKSGGSHMVSSEEAGYQDAQCILVLGASITPEGTPSNILKDRLDTGIELYKRGAAPKMIMSGDNGTEFYNEVLAMKNYAIAQGVPSEDIFCDHAGFSTYESMYRARNVFEIDRMIVVTQTYHLHRALYTANGLGVNAVGVASDLRLYQDQKYYDLREIPARTKDFFKTLFRTPATFSEGFISLDQSGDTIS